LDRIASISPGDESLRGGPQMSISVYIADDHAVVRDGLKVLLDEQADIEVLGGAADGREAVRQVVEVKPDVVLMDINMPELNGIEATHQIMDDCPATRVVILSMYATREHIFRALQAGARGYLLKESAGIEVVQAVREVMSGRRYLSEKISEDVIDEFVRLRHQMEEEDPLSRLSTREREVLQLVVEGKSSAEIAEALFLSPKTIETYRSRLMQKLEIHDIPSLVKFAIQHGLTALD
jgi:DNA-binding NarL/FixJ family response regulator